MFLCCIPYTSNPDFPAVIEGIPVAVSESSLAYLVTMNGFVI